MAYVMFHTYFPEVARRETRTITVFPRANVDVPPAAYSFLESFCDRPGCDCRRVFFTVVSSQREDVQAVVAWGWEPREFYERWFAYGDSVAVTELKGPVLNALSPQSDLAPAILNLVRDELLRDEEYVERVKRHYKMFREQVEAQEGEAGDSGQESE